MEPLMTLFGVSPRLQWSPNSEVAGSPVAIL